MWHSQLFYISNNFKHALFIKFRLMSQIAGITHSFDALYSFSSWILDTFFFIIYLWISRISFKTESNSTNIDFWIMFTILPIFHWNSHQGFLLPFYATTCLFQPHPLLLALFFFKLIKSKIIPTCVLFMYSFAWICHLVWFERSTVFLWTMSSSSSFRLLFHCERLYLVESWVSTDAYEISKQISLSKDSVEGGEWW